jgi:hypothetical protein
MLGKTDLTELWSDRLIANATELHFGQELFPDDLWILDYDLGNMNTWTPKIIEDIELQRGLIVKLLS